LGEALGRPFGNPGEISIEKYAEHRDTCDKAHRFRPKLRCGNFVESDFEKGFHSSVEVKKRTIPRNECVYLHRYVYVYVYIDVCVCFSMCMSARCSIIL
jgi:hypothetical protein